MARGWESKSVEAQIESREDRQSAGVTARLTLAQAELLRKKKGLLLARTKVLRDLETAQNPRYRETLNMALADLEGKLAGLV
jgi:hypothetical protein